MTDSFKMFLIALVTAVATQLLLAPYILRLQGFVPAAGSAPTSTAERDESEPAPASTLPGTAKLTAPNLEGMSVDAARERWRAKGIVIIEDAERTDSGAAAGTIVQQRPPAGATLDSKEIRVTVARAAAGVAVPDVVGKPFDDAKTAVAAAGFSLAEPERKPTPGATQGSIVAQDPAPGVSAARGSIVRLTIAEPELVEVPTLTGNYLAKAKKLLEEANLTVGSIRRVEHEERSANYVLRQEPEPGTRVPPGSAIELVVVAPN